MKSNTDKIRYAAEADLETFIRLVHPNRVLGEVHKELIRWITAKERSTHRLVLLPRDHMKSAIAGFYAAWRITKNPAIRILYISSTANLANKQLKFIKDILTSSIYRRYWPEMVNVDEGRREKWTETEIAVDHPLRKLENLRDPTVFAAGLTTTITGMHSDINILDDVVVRDNAYTEENRHKVEQQYSQLASIEGTDSEQLVVGTRYHPRDLYHTLGTMVVSDFNEVGEPVGQYNLYDKFERQVEVEGVFLWPRQKREDGKWFGFNRAILERKKQQYLDRTQFRAQYYNDPNDPEGEGIKAEHFQYYEKGFLSKVNGQWHLKNSRLNIFAAVDFAYTTGVRSDYTSIVVVGVDGSNNYYVLDIERFKTNEIAVFFDKILRLHQKWDFRKIKAEITAAQSMIVQDLRLNYIRPYGLALSIDDFKPLKYQGSKEERILAALQARYQNRQIWHFKGGHCETLEEELLLSHPPHDDIKDALATAIEACVAPTIQRLSSNRQSLQYHSRFGGII